MSILPKTSHFGALLLSLGLGLTLHYSSHAGETAGNPIVKNRFTADPCPVAVDNTLYIYTGHDEQEIGKNGFLMNDWYAYSTQDMVNYEEHGPLLSVDDFDWAVANAFASHVIERGGKYYWFVSLLHATDRLHEGMAIGVAVSDTPTGPFKDAIGEALVSDSTPNSIILNIDPAVYIDDDGQAYLYWGSWDELRMVKLKDNLIELDGEVQTVEAKNFFEAPFVHKRGDIYYLTYAGSGYPSKIEYSTSDCVEGPWEYQGVISDVLPKSETNHPGIVKFIDQWYYVYHTSQLPGGGVFRRSVCVDKLDYTEDGKINKVKLTKKGVAKL